MSTHDDALLWLSPIEARVLIKNSVPERRTERETIPFYDAAYVSQLRAQLTASEASRKELREALIAMVEHFERVDAKGESARVVQRGIAALANDAEQKGGAV